MYFIEILFKKFLKKQTPTPDFDPLKEQEDDEGYESCEHIFMPVDSTGDILSCKNCGLIVKKSDLKDVNFFRNH